jgi:hypothetical protein
MLRRIIRLSTLAILLLTSALFLQTAFISVSFAQSQESQLYNQLKTLPGSIEVNALKCLSPFKEKYLVILKQWLDPLDTTAGSFKQRVFVSHFSYVAPTVFVTEGYGGDYAESQNYIEELSKMFHTNQIFVEHRYFGPSTPANKDWKYLTTTNAAADHHRVRQLFGSIYKNKWIATGISKGGQTALIYRTLYPNDVDITVCYVAPLCFAVEDGRHEPFIANIPGTQAERDKLRACQTEILKKRKKIMPLFKAHCDEKKLTFNIPFDEVYDYCVLETSFAFWQWGWETSSIPSKKPTVNDLFNFFIRVSDPDYFSIEGSEPIQAFSVQAARELGYYGYDTKPFEKYLKIKTAKGYLDKIFMPKDYRVSFDKSISEKCAQYLKDNDPKMIFIYGEYDPWSAAAVNFGNKKNMYKAVCPGGSHRSRISSLPTEMKNEVVNRIARWLEE